MGDAPGVAVLHDREAGGGQQIGDGIAGEDEGVFLRVEGAVVERGETGGIGSQDRRLEEEEPFRFEQLANRLEKGTGIGGVLEHIQRDHGIQRRQTELAGEGPGADIEAGPLAGRIGGGCVGLNAEGRPAAIA